MTVSPKAETWFEGRKIDGHTKTSSGLLSLTGIAVLRFLDYEVETGILRWKENPSKPKQWNTRYAGKVAGSPNQWGHIRLPVCGRTWLAHRLVWLIETGEVPSLLIDHINGNPADNRFSNLRLATNAQNQWNRGAASTNKAGLKGVTWDGARRKWSAHVCADGRQKRIGYFSSKEEAFDAYCVKAKELHGEFFNSGEQP